MNYKETLDYLYKRLPMFQRIGAAAYKADLTNTIAICNILGDPQNKFKSIHIAGTNGKGSTSHMLAAILQCAGYNTGLYTSPHLKDFRERIRINGKMIPKKIVTGFVKEYSKAFEKIEPSFFEWTVGLGFGYFAKKKVDLAIIETGLGGRLDSTNVISPLVSVITNISYDHTALLGNTLHKIAEEKAGIIKPGTPVVIGETQNEIKDIFIEKAKKESAPIYFADKKIKTKFQKSRTEKIKANVYRESNLYLKNISPRLKGFYQEKNITTLIQIVELLKEMGYKISKKNIKQGIEQVSELTGLQGRWQVLNKKPLIIADAGHNEAGIKQVLEQLRQTPHKNLHFVLGVVNDKDISTILSLLPKQAVYYFCKAAIPRALDENELARQAGEKGLIGKSYPTVMEALIDAKRKAGKKDLIFVGGSTFTVADALSKF